MKVYYGNRGNEFYIMCRDFQECYVFNSFGTLERNNGLVSDCNNWIEVDIMSFVSRNLRSCELLFNDSKTVVNIPLTDAILKVRKQGGYIGTMFTITHEDNEGKYTQVLFVSNKGTFTRGFLEKMFGINSWNSLSY